jgi:hypothetical protein
MLSFDWHKLLQLDFGKVGFVTAVISLIVSILTFRRDRSHIVVALQWDALSRWEDRQLVERSAHIYVTNMGRRPAHITMVWLVYPDGKRSISLLTDETDSAAGKTLAEGDPPLIIEVPQVPRITKYSQNWRDIRAAALDSLGKKYLSKKVDTKPSWVD